MGKRERVQLTLTVLGTAGVFPCSIYIKKCRSNLLVFPARCWMLAVDVSICKLVLESEAQAAEAKSAPKVEESRLLRLLLLLT